MTATLLSQSVNEAIGLFEAGLFLFGSVCAWWHLDCDHPGCFRLPQSGRLCKHHKENA